MKAKEEAATKQFVYKQNPMLRLLRRLLILSLIFYVATGFLIHVKP